MAARKKKKKNYSERYLKSVITKLVNKHGKVRIYFQDKDYEPPCNCLCKQCKQDKIDNGDYYDEPDMRRRLLKKDGTCAVSYKSDGYRRWSGFGESCFMDNYEGDYTYDDDGNIDYDGWQPPNLSVKETLQYMFEHDENEWIPIYIEYGKRWKRKLKLV